MTRGTRPPRPGRPLNPNLTADEQKVADERAYQAATKEWENDPNIDDPKGVQGRVDQAVLDYRHEVLKLKD